MHAYVVIHEASLNSKDDLMMPLGSYSDKHAITRALPAAVALQDRTVGCRFVNRSMH